MIELLLPKQILPPDLMQWAYIAGGYAACPALASDIDVWVQVKEGQLVNTRIQILQWLESNMWPFKAEDNEGPLSDTYVAGVLKVAIVTSPHLSHPVHIIVTESTPIQQLELFDISTHQIALTWGGVVKGSQWKSIFEPPKVMIEMPRTATRLAKLTKRYGGNR